ncbi:MAG: hypothetical protein IKL82_00190 [Clostridia bacterium]|nr:hypothetical protein [Clostridia bacterium]
MNIDRKQKLISYLYPNEKIAEFMIFDFYVELSNYLPKKICFSVDNLNSDKRNANFIKATKIVKLFLENNYVYKNKLNEFFPNISLSVLVTNIIYGYVLYLTPHINKGSGADVFRDKRCVSYSPFSIIDAI